MTDHHPTPTYGYDNDRWLRVVGSALIALVSPPVFFSNTYSTCAGYWGKALISLVFTVAIWESNRAAFRHLAQKFPRPEDTARRIGWMAAVGVAITSFVCWPISPVLEAIVPPEIDELHPTWGQRYGASYILLLTVAALYESRRFFQLWQKTVLEKQQLERAHLASQLDGLRNQVNPHFLFNSLNTLICLIPEDAGKAVRFVQQLSKVYRYVLESRDDKIIPLAEEMEFLRAYIFLLKERFGDNLRIEIAEELSALRAVAIVPLTLQILFENAIKHNVISADKPLTISVLPVENGFLVRNNFQPKNQVMDSTGVGLDNIRQRYEMLSGQTIEVRARADFFEVEVPYLGIG